MEKSVHLSNHSRNNDKVNMPNPKNNMPVIKCTIIESEYPFDLP